jgi:hypothetical protein
MSNFGDAASQAWDETAIAAWAQMLDLPIPTACLEGVVANLRLLAEHNRALGTHALEGATHDAGA